MAYYPVPTLADIYERECLIGPAWLTAVLEKHKEEILKGKIPIHNIIMASGAKEAPISHGALYPRDWISLQPPSCLSAACGDAREAERRLIKEAKEREEAEKLEAATKAAKKAIAEAKKLEAATKAAMVAERRAVAAAEVAKQRIEAEAHKRVAAMMEEANIQERAAELMASATMMEFRVSQRVAELAGLF